MLAETRYEHIVLDDNKVPTIAGTTMKVVELVSAHLAYGWNAEELHEQFPYLTLGQIYSALAYYSDHKEEIDGDLERRMEKVDKLRRASDNSRLIARLKAKGLVK
ncbi:MAG: DUF433 domain-containing protein [Chloroflexota bacterium]